METVKRQIRAEYGCLVAGQSPWARVSSSAYRLYIRSVCDTKAPLQPQLRLLALYKCYMLLCDPKLSSDSFRENFLKRGIICKLLNTLSAVGMLLDSAVLYKFTIYIDIDRVQT